MSVVSSNGQQATISCNKCNQIFRPDKIENHLLQHVEPKYLTPQVRPNITETAKFNFNFEETSENSDPDIRELIFGKLTLPDQKKPNAPYTQPMEPDVITGFINNNRGVMPEQRTEFSQSSYINPGPTDFVSLTREVELRRKEAKLAKNNLRLYKNENSGATNYNKQVAKKKQHYVQDDTASSQGYIVSKGQIGTPEKTSKKIISIQLKMEKHPQRPYQPISTLEDTPIRPIPVQPTVTYEKHSNQCHTCHGFFCSQCRSTIPPQYRPCNMELREDIAKYYKDHVYNLECHICRKQIQPQL